MTEHMQVNRKDKHSMRGLITMLNKRRGLLLYLDRRDPVAFERVTEEFGIRRGSLRLQPGASKHVSTSKKKVAARIKAERAKAKIKTLTLKKR